MNEATRVPAVYPQLPSDKYHYRVQKEVSQLEELRVGNDLESFKRFIHSDMARTLAADLMKIGTLTEHFDLRRNCTVHALNVYVFTPRDFHCVVRTEARRLYEDMMRVRRPPSY